MSWCTAKVGDRQSASPARQSQDLTAGKALSKFPVALPMDVGQVAGAECSVAGGWRKEE